MKYIKEHPEIAEQIIKKQEDADKTIIETLTDMALKYDICHVPKRNILDVHVKTEYNTQDCEEFQNGEEFEKKHCETPQDYFVRTICATKRTDHDWERPITQEEHEFLLNLNKIDIEKRRRLIWRALENALKKTEIKPNMPLIEWIFTHMLQIGAKHGGAYPRWKNMELEDRFKISQIARFADIPYQRFYRDWLPRIKKILDYHLCEDII